MYLDDASISTIFNQIFEIEKKIKDQPHERSLGRNLSRLKATFEDVGYRYHDPLGEKYDLTRLDCEAMISGEDADNLTIVEVIKPIIYFKNEAGNTIVQKAVVVTEKK